MTKHFRTPSFPIYLSEKDPATRIQLFRTGTFNHQEYGKFEITQTMLADMKRNFDTDVRRIDVAIDFAHRNDDIAAGWIKELSLDEDGNELWAEVEWTPAGQKSVAAKEFRYISPEFSFAYQDNESLKNFGPVLLGAGLTNRPVIKEMEPVIELQEKLINQGGITMADEVKDSAGVEVAAKQAEEMKEQLAAVQSQLVAMQTKVTEVEVERDALKQEKVLSEQKQKFSVLLSEGKACPAQEKAFLANDMLEFIKLSEPMNLKVKGSEKDVEVKKEEEIPVDDKIIKLAEKLVEEKKAKNLSEAHLVVRREHPELFNEKYK